MYSYFVLFMFALISSMPRNFKLILAYDGTDFCGWQIQPHQRTIQGELSEAIRRVTGEAVLPQGSGRTDAGVHALAQVASFGLSSPIPAPNLQIALNHTLPPAIRVLSVEDAAEDFHARHSAKAKTYEYRIFRGSICPPFVVRYVYHHPYPLNDEAMCCAAEQVIGEHDFTSFAAVDPERSNDDEAVHNVRIIFSSSWERRENMFIYRVRGDGFLHHMVRNLVGTFLLVGKGSLSVDSVSKILNAKSRSEAGPTSPASGLFLIGVEY
jgi:tRNA pseudouridine38-40 synthase